MTATFELFNLFSQKPDWIFDATTHGTHIRLAGIAHAPVLPGPTDLHVAYVDEPRGGVASKLSVLRIDVARVRVEGTVRIGDREIAVHVDAALVT